jgi:hypothetical protein
MQQAVSTAETKTLLHLYDAEHQLYDLVTFKSAEEDMGILLHDHSQPELSRFVLFRRWLSSGLKCLMMEAVSTSETLVNF